jgi:hypothetical protein
MSAPTAPTAIARVPERPDCPARSVQRAYACAVADSSLRREGDDRRWAYPPDPAAWARQVVDWVGATITGPWGLPAETAAQACGALASLLAEAQASATVEIHRLTGSGYTAVIAAIVHPDTDPALTAVVHPESAVARFVAAFGPMEVR